MAHCLGPFLCHQDVSGFLLWSISCGSLFGSICVLSGCEWCLALEHKLLLSVWVHLSSGCEYLALEHKLWLTVWVHLCAIRM